MHFKFYRDPLESHIKMAVLAQINAGNRDLDYLLSICQNSYSFFVLAYFVKEKKTI